VVVLTGRGDDETFAQARKLGASQFLTKPVTRDALLKAVEAQLSAPLGAPLGSPKTRARTKKRS